jgi:hypothetical protein
MIRPFLYVSTIVRGSSDAEMSGFFYKVDWRSREVLEKIPVPRRAAGVFGSRGGSRGGRGMAVFGDTVYAATFDKILLFDRQLMPRRAISHPLVVGHHELQVEDTGIWCCSTLIDAVIKLTHDGRLLDACFLCEEEAMASAGLKRVMRDRTVDYMGRANADSESNLFEEQMHINTVVSHPDAGTVVVWGTNTGHLVRIRPRVEVLAHLPHLRFAHNVQPVGEELFVNHTRAGAFQIYSLDNRTAPRVHVDLDARDTPSEQFATSGWIRGMCWVAPDLLVVGTSPAGLISIDLNTMAVADRLQLEPDVHHAVHGLTADTL